MYNALTHFAPTAVKLRHTRKNSCAGFQFSKVRGCPEVKHLRLGPLNGILTYIRTTYLLNTPLNCGKSRCSTLVVWRTNLDRVVLSQILHGSFTHRLRKLTFYLLLRLLPLRFWQTASNCYPDLTAS